MFRIVMLVTMFSMAVVLVGTVSVSSMGTGVSSVLAHQIATLQPN